MTIETEAFRKVPQKELQKILEKIRATKINVLLVGGTGVGKSSTITALFQNAGLESETTIGDSTRPETMDISAHKLDNMVIWDSPGLGDSPEKDKQHRQKITEALHLKDEQGNPLIDLVFLILDAGSRDFSSAYTLIKEVIVPNIDKNDTDRLLIGLNQADQAMKGHYWNKTENQPEAPLVKRLDELAATVKDRIKTDTDLDIEPIYYSAGCIINGERLSEPYNLTKLLSFILDRLPKKKRAAIAMHINKDETNFRFNDGKADYREKLEESIWDSINGWLKTVAGDVTKTVGDMAKEALTNPENIKRALTFIAEWVFKKTK